MITDEVRAAVEVCIRRACQVGVQSDEWFCVDQWPDGSLIQRHGLGPFARNVDEDLVTIFVQEAIINLDPCGDYDEDTPEEDLIDEVVAGFLEDWEREATEEEKEDAALAALPSYEEAVAGSLMWYEDDD